MRNTCVDSKLHIVLATLIATAAAIGCAGFYELSRVIAEADEEAISCSYAFTHNEKLISRFAQSNRTAERRRPLIAAHAAANSPVEKSSVKPEQVIPLDDEDFQGF